jgi:hypothetical protein
MSPPLVPILSHMNRNHTTQSYFSKIHFNNVLAHLRVYLCNCLCMHFSSVPCVLYVHCPSRIWLDHYNYIWRRVQFIKLIAFKFCWITEGKISVWRRVKWKVREMLQEQIWFRFIKIGRVAGSWEHCIEAWIPWKAISWTAKRLAASYVGLNQWGQLNNQFGLDL